MDWVKCVHQLKCCMLISVEFQFRLDSMQKSVALIRKFETGIVCWNQIVFSRLFYLLKFTKNVCVCFGNNFILKSHINRWADKGIPCCDFQTKSWKTFSRSLNMGIFPKPKCSHHIVPPVPSTWHLSDDIFRSGCICGWIVIPGILMNGTVWNYFVGWTREGGEKEPVMILSHFFNSLKILRLSLDCRLSLLSSMCNNLSHWMHLGAREQHWIASHEKVLTYQLVTY